MESLGAVGDSVVVSLEVSVEQLVRVNTLIPQRLKHLIGTEVGESGVVDLDVAHTLSVQSLELLTVSLGQIGKEVLVVGTLEKAAEVVLAIKLAGGNSANAMLLLLLDDVGNGSLLSGDELLSRDLASIGLLLSAR
ncbi:hypothetical protein HG531_005588 [Fusarium graminearum]|nr:hypothetical protein HG531_005588 [Fusarium graminearum]